MNNSAKKSSPDHPRRNWSLFVIVGLMSICLVAAASSALSNLLLPAHTAETGQLSELDKARLSEAFHLRGELGDALWAGWGQADIPVILHNENYAFLVDYSNPPTGWIKIPNNKTLGSSWEIVPDEPFNGQVYYRQRLPDPNTTPQSFTVLIGNRWVASLASRDWMEIGLGNDFKSQVPAFLQPLFPYRLAGRLFLTGAGGKDWYILGIAHESFHAYEGIQDPSRLYAAEKVFNENEDRYPLDNEAFRQDWQAELNLLSAAVQAKSNAETIELVRQFLVQRQKRRTTANLDADMIMLENLKEWEEGLAKYTELTLWRLAATTPGYKPLSSISKDPGFKNYAGFQQRWSQEIQQINRVANRQSDERFYYSGLAQAALLDRLMPDWTTKLFSEDIFLEDWLKQAIKSQEKV
jgi:hypothetical protein